MMWGAEAPFLRERQRTILLALGLGVLGLRWAHAECSSAPAADTEASCLAWGAALGPVPKDWRIVNLSKADKPATLFRIAQHDGRPSLEIRVVRSYGALVHAAQASWAIGIEQMQWSWALPQALKGERAVDLRQKAGDDTALRLCVLFDQVSPKMPLGERILLGLARTFAKEPIPSATICYAWAPERRAGESLPNAYTGRLHWVIAESAPASGAWRQIRVQPQADYQRIFGHESAEAPRVMGIALGGDGDSTSSESLGYFGPIAVKAVRLGP